MDVSDKDTRPIVVGVDPSDSARAAADWAADLAAALRAPLHLVNVVPGATGEAPIVPIPGWLRELRDATQRAGADTDVPDVLPGATVEQLGAHAARARLLVLGSYGAGAWSGMLAGQVALALIDRVDCPVAVVRGPAPQMPPPRGGPVVVGVDGSEAGHAALRFAADIAASLGARLAAVHTWSDAGAGAGGGARRRPEDQSFLVAEGAAVLDGELTLVSDLYPGLPVERELRGDTALRALMAMAGEARMIVVGHRGRGVGTGMTLGSTSHALVEFAPCPVVVVRPDTVLDTAAAHRAAAGGAAERGTSTVRS